MKNGTKINHDGAVWSVTATASDGVLIENADGDIIKIPVAQAEANAVKRKRAPRTRPPRTRPAETEPTTPVAAPDPVITRSTFIKSVVAQTLLIIAVCLGGSHWLDQRGTGPGPSPDPIVDPIDPIPSPAPDNSKVKKGALIIVVEETAERDKFPHLATLQKDVKFWDGLGARGYKYAWLDAEMKQVAPYKSHWEKVGLPAVIAIMPDGSVPLVIPCPPSSETLNQHLEP